MRGSSTVLASALVSLFVVTGCGQDDRPANWSYIHAAIVLPGCTTSSCHTEFNAQAGVRLADRETAYNILTGSNCGEIPDNSANGNFVVPSEPENSRLMHLLIGEEVSRAMPPDRPLPDTDIDLIERWILAGAPCD